MLILCLYTLSLYIRRMKLKVTKKVCVSVWVSDFIDQYITVLIYCHLSGYFIIKNLIFLNKKPFTVCQKKFVFFFHDNSVRIEISCYLKMQHLLAMANVKISRSRCNHFWLITQEICSLVLSWQKILSFLLIPDIFLLTVALN